MNLFVLVILCLFFKRTASEVQREPCVCVPYFQCTADIINIRSSSECADYFEICCDPTATTGALAASKKCGYSNPEGVGFSIRDDDNSNTNFGEFPWMVALAKSEDKKLTYKCGGTLIHPQVVLTAAHCVNNEDTFEVSAGEWDPTYKDELFPHQNRNVQSIAIHPDYKPGLLHNDVALLFLETPVGLNEHINVICLSNSTLNYEKCVTIGWGKGLFNQIGVLKKQELKVIDRKACERGLRDTPLGESFELHESFVCAGFENYIAGSPLMCGDGRRYYQAGIASWNINTGGEVNSVFINVGLFKDWIDQQMNDHKFNNASYFY